MTSPQTDAARLNLALTELRLPAADFGITGQRFR